jgi:regulatory protein
MLRPAPAVEDELGQEFERALGLCLRDLDRRDQTVAQARGRLERSGVAEATIDAALSWLVERRYLDDAGYAERYAEDRRRLDGWGGERIRRRLEAVGVDPGLIEAALAERAADEELAAALAVLEARMTGSAGGARDRRRALGLLVRRGYEMELAEAAVARHFGRPADLGDQGEGA